MTGVQYSVYKYQTDMKENFDYCIIEKKKRESPTHTSPLSYYYMLSNGQIYQSPDLESILSSRLEKISYFLSEYVDTISR